MIHRLIRILTLEQNVKMTDFVFFFFYYEYWEHENVSSYQFNRNIIYTWNRYLDIKFLKCDIKVTLLKLNKIVIGLLYISIIQT